MTQNKKVSLLGLPSGTKFKCVSGWTWKRGSIYDHWQIKAVNIDSGKIGYFSRSSDVFKV